MSLLPLVDLSMRLWVYVRRTESHELRKAAGEVRAISQVLCQRSPCSTGAVGASWANESQTCSKRQANFPEDRREGFMGEDAECKTHYGAGATLIQTRNAAYDKRSDCFGGYRICLFNAFAIHEYVCETTSATPATRPGPLQPIRWLPSH